MRVRYALALTASLAASATAAQDNRGLIAMQQRGALLGWEGVGRVDKPGGFCTGVLVARDVVLTAAHCLFDKNGKPIPAERIVFRAGYSRGASMAERRATRLAIPEAYARLASGPNTGEKLASDVALMRLDAPIHSAEADPFAIYRGAPPTDLPVSVVSYGEGRQEVLSRQAECAVLQRYSDGILSFDCNITFGSSGSPVFVREDGRIRILAVMAAITGSEAARFEAFGLVLPTHVDALMRDLRNAAARPKVTTGARRIGVGTRMGTGGARFIRP